MGYLGDRLREQLCFLFSLCVETAGRNAHSRAVTKAVMRLRVTIENPLIEHPSKATAWILTPDTLHTICHCMVQQGAGTLRVKLFSTLQYGFCDGKLLMLSSVAKHPVANTSKSLFLWLLNSKRDPTMSPMIAPIILAAPVGVLLNRKTLIVDTNLSRL